MVSYLGHSEGLFGMTLNDIHWSDGEGYLYWPDKQIKEFTDEDCILTLEHIHDWLKAETLETNIY